MCATLSNISKSVSDKNQIIDTSLGTQFKVAAVPAQDSSDLAFPDVPFVPAIFARLGSSVQVCFLPQSSSWYGQIS